jgi:hypothetical protein
MTFGAQIPRMVTLMGGLEGSGLGTTPQQLETNPSATNHRAPSATSRLLCHTKKAGLQRASTTLDCTYNEKFPTALAQALSRRSHKR